MRLLLRLGLYHIIIILMSFQYNRDFSRTRWQVGQRCRRVYDERIPALDGCSAEPEAFRHDSVERWLVVGAGAVDDVRLSEVSRCLVNTCSNHRGEGGGLYH